MATEIERKFLVDPERLPPPRESFAVLQGYLKPGALTVRVRIQEKAAFLTLKSREPGIQRTEFEYPIPLADARDLLERFSLPGVIEKERRLYRHAGRLWEVDVFHGENEGLVLAEVELDSKDEQVEIPEWAIEEVSGDARYFNAALAREPFPSWPENKRNHP